MTEPAFPPASRRGMPCPTASMVGGALVLVLAGCASGGGATEGTASGPAPTAQAPSPRPQPAEPTAGGAAGIFTAAQADRGNATFDDVCAECHTTSEFRGRSFQADWGRRTVYSFYRTIRSTMPDDDPGGLDEQVYLDVVAYILKMNGHGAGPAELDPDSPMREVRVGPSPSGS